MATVEYNQPDPEYRRELGENQSYLKNILISPAHYQAAKKRRFLPTINMEIGSALHCKVLEGDEEFHKRYILKPEGISLNTKEGKEWKLQNKSKTVLTNSEKEKAWDSVHGMTESLRKLEWFDNSQPDYRKFNELSIYWKADQVPCKGRLDRLVIEDDCVTVLDLKTTDSVDPDMFSKKVSGGMNYIFQAAWYAEAASLAYDKPARFIFVAIERGSPWSVGIFEVSKEMMEEGIQQIKMARQVLMNCLTTKTWPKPEIQYNMLNLPPWYRSPLDSANYPAVELF